MDKELIVKREKIVKRISILGVFVNLLLVCIKLVIGFFARSQGMIADGIHSIEDTLSSLMSYIGVKISSRPKDEKHPYGYGKAEYIFSELISLSMLAMSYIMFQTSIQSIIQKQQVIMSVWVVLACFITISIKLCLFLYTRVKAKETNNILIQASKIDQRNDIFMTSATLIGIFASYFGFHFVDGLMGCVISIVIAISGFKLFLSSCKILMDTNLDKEKLNEIIRRIENNYDILHVDSITSKPLGSQYIILLKISMQGSNLLQDTHEIAGRIKSDLMNEYEYIEEVIIHVNPH